MSDERTDTNISSLGDELPPRARQHPLPWVLFGVAATLLAIVGGLLARRVNVEVARANEERKKSATAEEQVKTLLAQQKDWETKVADADQRAKAADDAKLEAETKLKKLEGEKGGAGEVAQNTATDPPPKKGKADPPPKKGKKGKKGKKR